MSDALRKYIRNIIVKEIEECNKIDKELDEEDEELDETSSVSAMGGGDGYQTPGAFSKPGEDQKKKRALQHNKWEIVGEGAVNLRDKKLTPQHRMNKAVGYARKQMNEIEKIIDKAVKFKNENDVSTDVYWNRTHSSLKKLAEQLVRISHKLNNFK